MKGFYIKLINIIFIMLIFIVPILTTYLNIVHKLVGVILNFIFGVLLTSVYTNILKRFKSDNIPRSIEDIRDAKIKKILKRF